MTVGGGTEIRSWLVPLVSISIAISSPLATLSARGVLRPFLTAAVGGGVSFVGCPLTATVMSCVVLVADGADIFGAVKFVSSSFCALMISSRDFSDSGSSGSGPKNDFDGVNGIGLPS